MCHLFDSLNYKSVLKRGFALVRDMDGQPLRSAEAVLDGQALVLEFADGKTDATRRIGTRPRLAKPKIGIAEEQEPCSEASLKTPASCPHVKGRLSPSQRCSVHEQARSAPAAKPWCNISTAISGS